MAHSPSMKLAVALRDKTLVKFTRPFEQGSVNGYVREIGPVWFLLSLLGDGISFNGFQCFRLSHVRELQMPHPYCAFAEAALKMKHEYLPRKPRVTVAAIDQLLISANRLFPLVTIHREKAHPGVCQIGRVVKVSHSVLTLMEINPDASWNTEASQYRLAEITRVDFGGEYEEALHLVGGRYLGGQ